MSPYKKKELNLIRKKLDKIDFELLKIIKKRTLLIDQVIKLKTKKKEIVDKNRIKIILNKIKKKSIKEKIDPKITKRIWKNMIWSYIDMKEEIFIKNNTYYEVEALSIKVSCFCRRIVFFTFNFIFAFSPPAGFFT